MRRSGVFLWPLLAASLACGAYLNALNNPFVYDDHATILSNPSIVDLSNLRFVLVYSPFRPVVNLSYAIDRAVWGPEPFGFHVTNVGLHALTVVLLYVLVLNLLGDARREPDGNGQGAPARLAAFAAAGMFAVHPLMSEAVGYVSGRAEVLCALFFIAALLLGRSAMIAGGTPKALAAALCGVLALASKENGVALPVVLLACDWLLRPGTDAGRRRRLWWFFAPLFVVVAVLGGYRLMTLSPASVAATPSSPGLTLLTQSIVIWRYIGLLVWPMGQTIMHGARSVTSFGDPAALVAAAGLVSLMVLAFRVRRAHPLVSLGVVWFLAALAPSSSVVALRETMAEHRMYLAAAGVMLALAAGLHPLLDRARQARQKPVTLGAGLAVVLAALFVLTVIRNDVWASPVALWTEAVRAAPGAWEPHYALGDALREANQCDRALPEYERVVALFPAHRDAYVNMGICLGQTGRLQAAESALRRALEIDPHFARGYTNLATVALLAGDADLARSYYREAIAQDPGNVLARMQLAKLYEEVYKDYSLAAEMCGQARLIAPSTPGVVECVERNGRLAAGKDR